ncbi:MAG: hypothetical protein WBP54_13455 [Pelodictyon phaeoclathratiforme]
MQRTENRKSKRIGERWEHYQLTGAATCLIYRKSEVSVVPEKIFWK